MARWWPLASLRSRAHRRLRIDLLHQLGPPVDDRQHRICLLRREHRDDPPNAYLGEVFQPVGIRREAEQGDLDRLGIAPGLLRHLAELRQDIAEIAPRDRDPAIAVADRATRALREGSAYMDGRMGLRHRLRPRDHRVEIDEFAVVLGMLLRPDLLHRLDGLAHALEAAGVDGAV